MGQSIHVFQGRGDQKFIPRISDEDLKSLSMVSTNATTLYNTISQTISGRRPRNLGFPSDVAQSMYYPGFARMTHQEIDLVSKTLEKEGIFPENTRIYKAVENGIVRYDVLQASVDRDNDCADRQIPLSGTSAKIQIVRGDHSAELEQVCDCLKKAQQYAANSVQKHVIAKYLESFQTGDLEAYRKSQQLWVKDLHPAVENAFGFVEPYRDPHGTRAEFEGLVAIVDIDETKVLTKIVESSAEYIRQLPWAENATENDGKGQFEKELFEPPDFTSLQTLAYCSSIIFPGINLPNYNDIRQEVGFKNVMISNQITAEYKADRKDPAFIDPAEAPAFIVAEYDAFYIWVVLHELLGHGTSKLLTQYEPKSFNFDITNPPISPLSGKPITTWYKPGESWTGVFGDLATSLDECRAECVGAYLMDDEDLLTLFGFDEGKMSAADITWAVYLEVGTAGLRALENYIEDDQKWGQAHSRAHFAMFRVLLNAGESFLTVTHDVSTNKLIVHIDRSKILSHGKPAIGKLLLRLHIYRCTADVGACREYFEGLTKVEGIFAEWRQIVIASKKPRQILVQANTFLGRDGKVILKEYDATVEGMIQSWAERRV